VRAGRVRQDAVSRSTHALRQAASEVAVAAHHLGAGDRAAVLRAPRRQDADRDAHPRHAAQRRLIQLAVYVRSVAERVRSRPPSRSEPQRAGGLRRTSYRIIKKQSTVAYIYTMAQKRVSLHANQNNARCFFNFTSLRRGLIFICDFIISLLRIVTR